jgi:hypothetical protein
VRVLLALAVYLERAAAADTQAATQMLEEPLEVRAKAADEVDPAAWRLASARADARAPCTYYYLMDWYSKMKGPKMTLQMQGIAIVACC